MCNSVDLSEGYSLHKYDNSEHLSIKGLSYFKKTLPDYSLEVFNYKTNKDFFYIIKNSETEILDFSQFYDLNFGDLVLFVINCIKFEDYVNEIEYLLKKIPINNFYNQKMKLDNALQNFEMNLYELLLKKALLHFYFHLKKEEKNFYFDILEKFSSSSFDATNKTEIFRNLPPIETVLFPNIQSKNPDYYFKFFDDVLIMDIYNILENDLVIKQCQNCGKYFIPSSRSDEIYCYNEFKNGKTCKQLGYEVKLNNDEFLKAYRTAYKTQHAKMQRNKKNKPDYKEKVFDVWVKSAKEKLNQAKNGDITLEEFKKFLNVK